MFWRRALLALTFGSGITALLFVTVGMTWLIGIAFLSPGIWLASLITLNGWASLLLMLLFNSLIYSVPSYLLTILLVSEGRAATRVLSISALITLVVVFVGWAGTREFEKQGWGICGNEEVSHSLSPDGARKVVVFVRDCGVLGGDGTEVLLVDRNRQLNHLDTGNVLVTDERDDVLVEWKSPTSIAVSYPKGARIMKNESNVGGISIQYEAH